MMTIDFLPIPHINNGDIIITNGGYILPLVAYPRLENNQMLAGHCSLTKYFNPSFGLSRIRICENWGVVPDDTQIAYYEWTNRMPQSEFIEFINSLLW